ncbi:MAG: helix-hairpin-helix domain-containing protein [Candidatus Heimdallarchaeaceae archaeon]
MSSKQEIVIINIGPRLSPFLTKMIEKGTISSTYITNNACDFSIHHADPSKELDYHLEFTNLITLKAKKGIESVAVFETLGQFFEFYNPLHLSTLNFLFSKFATTIKNQTKNLTEVWKTISNSIFDENFVYPLFDEVRSIHVKEGDVEIPVRQLILSYEKQIEDKKNSKLDEETLKSITGIIDLDEVDKMKINPVAVKKLEQAAGIIIVPTDLISLFIVFHSSSFRDALKKTSGEIAIISPFYKGYVCSKIEEHILKKTEFEPSLLNMVNFIGDAVDAIIIDKKDSNLVAKLREVGITVIVDELSKERQESEEFLETVLKSIGVDPDQVRIEPEKMVEGFSDRIVSVLSSRLAKPTEEKEEPVEEYQDEEEETTVIPEVPTSKEVDELSTIADIMNETDIELTKEFEMDIADSDQDIQTEEVNEQEDKVKITDDWLNQTKHIQFALPSIDEITRDEWQDFNAMEADEQIISAYIDRALLSNDMGLEIAFSDLLSLQNNELLVDKIYRILMKRLVNLISHGSEKKLTDIITFLAAHKPTYYIQKFEELLEKTIHSQIYTDFEENLKTASMVIGRSFPVGEDVVCNFIKRYIEADDEHLIEKLRLIVREFYTNNTKSKSVITHTLLSVLYDEMVKEEEEIRKDLVNTIVIMLSMLDAHNVGLEAIQIFSASHYDILFEILDSNRFTKGYSHIVKDILNAFQETNLEQLKAALHGLKLPRTVQSLLIKESYKRSLSKVGSIPLDIFAEQSGLPTEKAEKLIYDMILKGEIKARIELVNERLYIVQEREEVDAKEEKKECKELEEEKEEKEPEPEKKELEEKVVEEEGEKEGEEKDDEKPEEEQVTEETKPKPKKKEKNSKKLDIELISGLGKKAEILKAIGFDSVDKIANADLAELIKIKGIGETSAERFIQQAKEILLSHEKEE